MISTSPKKEKEALNTLGADHFVVSKDEAQLSVRALLLRCSQPQTYIFLCFDIPAFPSMQHCLNGQLTLGMAVLEDSLRAGDDDDMCAGCCQFFRWNH